MSISENIARIREQIAAAAHRASRNPGEITLMAVSKTFPAANIRQAYAAGLRVFGESRVQEFAGKFGELAELPEAEWHMIGHLQANKSAKAAELFAAIDSVDSLRLARRMNAAAGQLGKKLAVLLEINIGGETAKSGIAPGGPDLDEILEAAPELPHLEIRGLMTVPPFTEDPEGARPYFRKLRQLQRGLAARHPRMSVLSMGMSHDFEIAIEEGSTCVRVGTGIFGER